MLAALVAGPRCKGAVAEMGHDAPVFEQGLFGTVRTTSLLRLLSGQNGEGCTADEVDERCFWTMPEASFGLDDDPTNGLSRRA